MVLSSTATLEAESNGRPDPAPVRHLTARVSFLYGALYIHYGFYAFLPLWLTHSGSSPRDIGILMAIPLVLRLITVAPFSAWVGRRQHVRSAIGMTALVAAAFVCALMVATGPIARIVAVLLFSIVWDQIPVLLDAYAGMAVRSRSLDFGRLRVWGSIAVVVSNAAAGWAIGLTGVAILPLLIAALLILPAIAAFGVPRDALLTAHRPEKSEGWREIFADRPLMCAMIAASLIMGSHGVIMNFGAIQWAALGFSTGQIGLLNAVAVASEIIAFIFGGVLLGARDPRWMIGVAAVTAALRWGVMAMNPSLPVLLAAQSLQGVSATGALLAPILMITKRVPNRLAASAQGLNAVLLGVALAVVIAGSGFIWKSGAGYAYGLMIVIALAALPFLWTRGTVSATFNDQNGTSAPT